MKEFQVQMSNDDRRNVEADAFLVVTGTAASGTLGSLALYFNGKGDQKLKSLNETDRITGQSGGNAINTEDYQQYRENVMIDANNLNQASMGFGISSLSILAIATMAGFGAARRWKKSKVKTPTVEPGQ